MKETKRILAVTQAGNKPLEWTLWYAIEALEDYLPEASEFEVEELQRQIRVLKEAWDVVCENIIRGSFIR